MAFDTLRKPTAFLLTSALVLALALAPGALAAPAAGDRAGGPAWLRLPGTLGELLGALFGGSGDLGPDMDPDGVLAGDGDLGPGMDPDGLGSGGGDLGPGMDPDG